MATEIKKILVTGGSGFIGTHLIKALGERGANYDIKTTDQGIMDVLDYDMLEGVIGTLKPSAIIHLAAVSNRQDTDRNPQLAIQTNIVGSYNVLKAAQTHKIRVILASSAAVYESKLSLYGITKKCMEIMAELFENAVVVRFFNVYGPGSKSVINKFIKAVKTGKDIKLNGNTVRDYIYVDDIVQSLIALADAIDPERYVEIGTGRGITLRKLVSLIQKLTGRKSKIIYGDPIKEIQESQCSFSSPYYKTTLEQGIKKIL